MLLLSLLLLYDEGLYGFVCIFKFVFLLCKGSFKKSFYIETKEVFFNLNFILIESIVSAVFEYLMCFIKVTSVE